jgi:hypothetical protein
MYLAQNDGDFLLFFAPFVHTIILALAAKSKSILLI